MNQITPFSLPTLSDNSINDAYDHVASLRCEGYTLRSDRFAYDAGVNAALREIDAVRNGRDGMPLDFTALLRACLMAAMDHANAAETDAAPHTLDALATIACTIDEAIGTLDAARSRDEDDAQQAAWDSPRRSQDAQALAMGGF